MIFRNGTNGVIEVMSLSVLSARAQTRQDKEQLLMTPRKLPYSTAVRPDYSYVLTYYVQVTRPPSQYLRLNMPLLRIERP
jgi:hypothetical protein